MKARTLKKQEARAQKRKRLQRDRVKGRHDWWQFLSDRDLGRLVRGYMTEEEAFKQLRAAGLHVRAMGGGGMLTGGSHVDYSSGFGMVENGFYIRQNDGTFFLKTLEAEEQPMTLMEAVDHVIATIKPEPNIPTPPRPERSGTVLY